MDRGGEWAGGRSASGASGRGGGRTDDSAPLYIDDEHSTIAAVTRVEVSGSIEKRYFTPAAASAGPPRDGAAGAAPPHIE
ncbi:hypothetical protein EVAR_22969_1 [Eumeta japonica]|uniref:Uncharacterized protein n=1 Tax=Eumeta variegata TaxID=151549 RepID=A0A4C1URA1_EUMVA|nr:hypothetical protein EVAR_22969_1 [Eumeta japonica]